VKNAAIIASVAAIFGGGVGLWTLFRKRPSIAGWAFLAGMLLLALEAAFSGLAVDANEVWAARSWQLWRLAVMSILPGTWLVFSLSYARGNAGEFLFRWRFILMAAFAFPLAMAFVFFRQLATVEIPSATPDSRLLQLGLPGWILYGMFLAGVLLVLMNLEQTFRAAVGTMRWRIKFMVLGLGILFAVRAYTSSEILLMRGRGGEASLLEVDSAGLLIGCGLMVRSLLRGPMDVAVYPSFTVLQNSLVLLLAGIYLLAVGVLAKIMQWLGGNASFHAKVFAVLLLLVGAVVTGFSERARLIGGRFLSRYLQRPLYDYRTVWRSFTEAIASRVKQEELCEAAVRQVAEIFKALSVSIWLVDEKRENLVFANSTLLSPAKGNELSPATETAREIIRIMEERPEPEDIETSREGWAAALRRCHPTQFRTGGRRICVPMHAGAQLMGVMLLGDRVGGISFSLQDFDLLKCAGNQVAAGLLNAQLSQKLLQTKELEAFQTMSAFFVHDLKNTASTLNLMLKNLPVHFDNPEFREDALRGVGKTCEHINNLISRLSLLRHDLQIHPAAADLNEVVERALASWNGAAGVTLVKHMQPGLKTFLDQDQIFKVVTNLMLNATEAAPKGGQIVVETSQNNGWMALTVSDNGCGMEPEFMRNALFRPFQTTKKNGFGIGMFQSKMIVEAHGGRIEVESELKKGTTFRVLLPVRKELK
jgi:putative PEP-CTERM system histidine kinase